MSYLRRGIKGLSIIVLSNILGNFFGYLTRVVLARSITPAEYGLFFSIMSLILLISTFSHLGFGSASVKYIAHYKAAKNKQALQFTVFFTSLIRLLLGLSISAILFFSAPLLATYYFKNPSILFIIRLFAIILFFYLMINLQKHNFQGFQKLSLFGLEFLSEKLLFFILIIVMFSVGFSKNIYIITYAFLIGIITTFLLFLFPLFTIIFIKKVKISIHVYIAFFVKYFFFYKKVSRSTITTL